MERGGKAEKRRKEKQRRGYWDIEEKMTVKGRKTETHGGKRKLGKRKGFCNKIRKFAKNGRKNGKKEKETPLYTYHAIILLGIIIIIIIISCYPLHGHRASTKRRHLILFLASFLTSPQLFPSSNASLWTDLLHVCLGLPLLCSPCGFQSKASFSMASLPFLNVCPTQFHFRLLICMDISISSAFLQCS